MPTSDRRDLERRAARIATRQWGLIARKQALAVGLTPVQVRELVRSGRWIVVAPGVYGIAGTPPSWKRDALVACLALGPVAVASHLTAAALFELCPPPLLPHATVAPSASARLRLARVHRSLVADEERTSVAGVPCTTVPRLLVDCASILPERRLVELVDAALSRRLATAGRVAAAIESPQRAPGRAGTVALRRALTVWGDGIVPGSPAEMRLLRTLARWGYTPQRQVEVRDDAGRFVARLDLAWPAQRYGLEYDSDTWHGPRRWRGDDDRDERLAAAGWRVDHVGAGDLQPSALPRLRADLVAALGSRAVA